MGRILHKDPDKGRGRKELPKAVGYKDTQLHIYALVYYYDSLVSTKLLLLFPALWAFKVDPGKNFREGYKEQSPSDSKQVSHFLYESYQILLDDAFQGYPFL